MGVIVRGKLQEGGRRNRIKWSSLSREGGSGVGHLCLINSRTFYHTHLLLLNQIRTVKTAKAAASPPHQECEDTDGGGGVPQASQCSLLGSQDTGIPPRPRAWKPTPRKEGMNPPPRGGQGEGESWGELQPGYSTRQGRRGRGPNSASTVCLHSSTTQKQQHTNHVCNLTFLAHVLNV